MRVAFLEYRTHDALAFARQRDQQMERRQPLMLILLRDRLRLLDRFLSFLREFVKTKQCWPAF